MNWKKLFLVLIVSSGVQITYAQETDSIPKKYFIGSTFFMLANLLPEPPQYYQLNFGYRFNARNVVTFEAITWNYKGPLGRQYGPHYENPASNFPGKVRAFGAGLTYKRFLWKQAYAQVHSTLLRQHYLNPEGEKIQSGYQLFNTVRLGYQFRFWKNRLFIEPSIACTFWPVNTNLPDSFQVQEDKFPKHFLGEPGLHFGINF